ncbi:MULTISPECIES: hypothetical protein [unclassified Bradyrhizobium]|uniref:hypothetical protein n=1 Tax=unclassified Bradyrhizobium TaxID=2631580 RepID=UPI00247A2C36|nr:MULTISPECIES: hypothetical protein [unclassified Bradyrhizobium]WGS23284.1 hypothetical protein MTX22_17595 [Bradyrhizobium sp. ISRA463]WGS30292.1 hypothetical protein MTX19_15320 [Bradyrhizobium sp. ISRA464]
MDAMTERLDRLVDELRLTPGLTPHLISRVVTDACTRLPSMARAGRAARLDRLVHAESWIDAVLALIELELPMWRPCRLIYDGGEWVCSLSRHPEVPFEFDDTADGRHEVQAIAILLSFVEAKRLLTTTEQASASSVPQVAPSAAAYTFCCDNFG